MKVVALALLVSLNAHAQTSEWKKGYDEGFTKGFQIGQQSCSTPVSSVFCGEIAGKNYLLRSRDQAIISKEGERGYFSNANDCTRAEATATDELACAPAEYFGRQIYLYDVWANVPVGGGQFAESCYDAISRIESGDELICVYGQSTTSLKVYNAKRKLNYFSSWPPPTVSHDECKKIVTSTRNGKFCFRGSGGWRALELASGRSSGEEIFTSLDMCLNAL